MDRSARLDPHAAWRPLRDHAWIRDDHTWAQFFRSTMSAQIHSIGALAALIGLVPLVVNAARVGGLTHAIACAVFVLSAVLVFSVSTIYHVLHDGFAISKRLENAFENIDHSTIYIFIAGTYTPFLLNTVSDSTRLLFVIWGLVVIGVMYTLASPVLPKWMRSRALYTGLFCVMGFTFLWRIGDVIRNLSVHQLWLLFSGAAAYTVGAVVYASKKPSFFPNIFGFHELWHLFVLTGFAFHYALIYSFYRG